jgi:hypothetical protein
MLQRLNATLAAHVEAGARGGAPLLEPESDYIIRHSGFVLPNTGERAG